MEPACSRASPGFPDWRVLQFCQMQHLREISLNNGVLTLPQFLPDATFGQVRGLDAPATAACGVKAVMMNTFHLMQKPGSGAIRSLGGLRQMTGWEGAVFTDSGGFQAYSLIRQNSRFGQLNDNGIIFFPSGRDRKFMLTPEKCVQLQMGFGAQVIFCLDDCTHVDDPQQEQEKSVARTVAWGERCKKEYSRLLEEKRVGDGQRPLIFAVVQGGQSLELRTRCAQALLETGFDGFGYGGWPLDESGALVEDMLALTRALIPSRYPLHALGVGHPPFIARCARMGYSLFDSAMPTRDARHGRLYRFASQSVAVSADHEEWFEYVYVHDRRHHRSSTPIEDGCGCPVCSRYSLAYLRHLYKLNDSLYLQLATMHNLAFMARLMEHIRIRESQ